MNRASKFIVAFLIVVFLLLAGLIGAERFSPPQPQQPGVYVVQKGDTLWSLVGIKWEEIVAKNPFLQEPGRVFHKNGKWIVIIKPFEQLKGLDSLSPSPPAKGWFDEYRGLLLRVLAGLVIVWLLVYGYMAVFVWNKPPKTQLSSDHLRAVH